MAHELKRISYVEDEPDIRAVTELALTELGGFELDVSVNGVQAIERIPRFLPDLILLDVMMPGLDGIEVFRRVHDSPVLRRIPAIFMTAKAQTHEVAEYLAIGAAGVIPKPYDPMSICEEIRTIWGSSWQAMQA